MPYLLRSGHCRVLRSSLCVICVNSGYGRAMDESALREILELERQATLTRVQRLNFELNEIIADAMGANRFDTQDPVQPLIHYERERIAGLLEDAHEYLVEIDQALVKLEDGACSMCEKCGTTIPDERLVAFPTSRTCVDCAAVRP
jgi:DnaK suppressor protein